LLWERITSVSPGRILWRVRMAAGNTTRPAGSSHQRGDTSRPAADNKDVGAQIVARPFQDATALAVAGHLEKVFGGWRPPPVMSDRAVAAG